MVKSPGKGCGLSDGKVDREFDVAALVGRATLDSAGGTSLRCGHCEERSLFGLTRRGMVRLDQGCVG